MTNLNLLKLIVLPLALLATVAISRSLYQGFCSRRLFRKLRANGVPVPQSHSLLFGHLLLCKKLLSSLPKDSHMSYWQYHLVRNWQQLYPDLKECPPMIYLDLWPFVPPLVLTVDPGSCEMAAPLPRSPMIKFAIFPLTDGLDLISANKPDHKVWRARLNPGFSSRNLMDHVPAVVEECEGFVEVLKGFAGRDGEWGEVFTIYNRAVSLTFAIICRVSLGFKIGDQRQGSSDFELALLKLLEYVEIGSLYERLRQLLPSVKRTIAKNNRVMRTFILPEVEAKIAAPAGSLSGPKTVIDLAIKEIRNSTTAAEKAESAQLDKRTIDIIIAQLKIFLFAGHDTTSIAISWAFHHLKKSPDVLAKLRDEHSQVLGTDPQAVAAVLRANPHKLNELPYTNAVAKETLRMHQTAFSGRQGSAGCSYAHNGVEYPTDGFAIGIGTMSTHFRPDLWARADDFVPERFLAAEGDPLYPVKFAWRPFETGPWNCIGQELAMMEMRVVLAMTARTFDFDFPWHEWDQMRGMKQPAETLYGERAYQAGGGLGHPKDDMPTRVRLRS